jgi:hypothetical protein
MENHNKLWHKTAYIGIKEPIIDIIECNQTTIIWTKSSILGYYSLQNNILWKINTPDFHTNSTEVKLRNFNGKAVFLAGIGKSSLKDLVFAIEPETGRILWSLGEGQTRTYILIPSKSESKIMPVYNRRKEGFVEKKYIVYIDIETGKKLQEVQIPIFYHKGVLIDNHLFVSDIWSQLIRCDINYPNKEFIKVCDGQIAAIQEIQGSVYYLLEDKKTFTINKIDLSNNQITSIDWPFKKSVPSGHVNSFESIPESPGQLFISWITDSDLKNNYCESKFGVIDFNQQKLLWHHSFDCFRRVLVTHNGFFTGTVFWDINGNETEAGVKLDSIYACQYFYCNNLLLYYNGAHLEIFKWCEAAQEPAKADNSGTQIYNFNDFVKV